MGHRQPSPLLTGRRATCADGGQQFRGLLQRRLGQPSHGAGLQKATQEFVPLLNPFYHRWQGTPGAPTPAPTPTATSTVTLGIELYLPIILQGYLHPGGPTP